MKFSQFKRSVSYCDFLFSLQIVPIINFDRNTKCSDTTQIPSYRKKHWWRDSHLIRKFFQNNIQNLDRCFMNENQNILLKDQVIYYFWPRMTLSNLEFDSNFALRRIILQGDLWDTRRTFNLAQVCMSGDKCPMYSTGFKAWVDNSKRTR